jgi:hypothetical protein
MITEEQERKWYECGGKGKSDTYLYLKSNKEMGNIPMIVIRHDYENVEKAMKACMNEKHDLPIMEYFKLNAERLGARKFYILTKAYLGKGSQRIGNTYEAKLKLKGFLPPIYYDLETAKLAGIELVNLMMQKVEREKYLRTRRQLERLPSLRIEVEHSTKPSSFSNKRKTKELEEEMEM